MDIVYPVRPGDSNPELRYSLRCLEANYPHNQVWIVGHQPNWLININYIPGGNSHNPLPGGTNPANVYHNILTACEHADTPDEFIVFNDDFFVTEPIIEIPIYYRGTLDDHIHMDSVRKTPNSWWAKSLQLTRTCLQTWAAVTDYPDPILSYELHLPIRVNKNRMADTLRRFAKHAPTNNPPQWRSLYGNLHQIGGTQRSDVKMMRGGEILKPFHSTNDSSLRRYYSDYFRSTYPELGKYEKEADPDDDRAARRRGAKQRPLVSSRRG